MTKVHLTGRLICGTAQQVALVERYLPDHVALTRAEPGCEMFEVTRDAADPMVWDVRERFSSQSAFDAHQARGAASAWGRESAGIRREFTVTVG
jgi:quinol monooxygenase YgiN